jgi:hypothetical protein
MTYSSRRFRAQIAFEYMFIFAIFMVALIGATWFAWSRSTEINNYYERLEIESLLKMVSGKIDTAWLEGPGFSTNMTLPETVVNLDYTLNVTSNFLLLTVKEGEYVRPIITNNVTGNFTFGAVNTLTNMGDYIEISSQ